MQAGKLGGNHLVLKLFLLLGMLVLLPPMALQADELSAPVSALNIPDVKLDYAELILGYVANGFTGYSFFLASVALFTPRPAYNLGKSFGNYLLYRLLRLVLEQNTVEA